MIALRAFALLLAALPFLFVQPTEAATSGKPLRRLMYMQTFNAESIRLLKAKAGDIDALSPVYFQVNPDGSVEGKDRPEVREALRGTGVKIIPMLRNEARYGTFSPALNDPKLRTKAIDRLVELVKQHNYDGLNIDFEALNASDRAGLNAWVAEMGAKLRPLGKLNTVAVAAKTKDLTTGWAGVYDYASLGASSDYVVLMTYAYRPVTDKPGSTAPIAWVEATAQHAANVMPASKVLLGMGLWAYDWNTTTGAAATVKYTPEAEELAKRPGAQPGYDTTDQSAYVRYSDSSGSHVVWYEDERALRAKLALIGPMKLGGWAGWRLGQESDAAWRAFDAFDNGTLGPAPKPTANGGAPSTGGSPTGGSSSGSPTGGSSSGSASSASPSGSPAAPAPAPAGAKNWAIANGHFFTQTGDTAAKLGYAVTDEDGVFFHREFNKLGGVDRIGFPLTQRFMWNGFVTQGFQKAIFQWDPATAGVNFVNVFDELALAGKDTWLNEKKSTPRPLGSEFDAGRSFADAQAKRLALLDANPAIKSAYHSAADPMRAFGLPTSAIEDNGNHYAIRLQRAVIQLWTKDVPWAKAGTVTIANGGEIALDAGLLPSTARTPKSAP